LYINKVMEKWYNLVLNFKDESVDSYKTQDFCHQVFRELDSAKIKEKGKFKQRMGPEFEQWSAKLSTQYPPELVTEILQDDEFWLETLWVTQKIRD
jgi:hypothetical protein